MEVKRISYLFCLGRVMKPVKLFAVEFLKGEQGIMHRTHKVCLRILQISSAGNLVLLMPYLDGANL
jgi:hypothetical protein